jgi:hypothetical protein
MMSFRTLVELPPTSLKIGQNSRFLTIGSCFSDAIGSRLNVNKFPALVNPFGTIYNPVSIHTVLKYAATGSLPAADSYLRNQEICLNYDLHSSFSGINQKKLENKIASIFKQIGESLPNRQFILLTYGTAWVFTNRQTGHIVANCHKQPSALFEKRLLTTDEIIDSFSGVYELINRINPQIKFILTVSPVRHIKDTLPLNSVSKATVRLACEVLANKFDGVEYFPAYEIMMDDLRDYRFYKSDMLHPTEQAEDYIWDAFVNHYMDADAKAFTEKWKHILSALNHKSFHPESSGHKNFLKNTLRKLEELQSIVPVDDEINWIKAQLDN